MNRIKIIVSLIILLVTFGLAYGFFNDKYLLSPSEIIKENQVYIAGNIEQVYTIDSDKKQYGLYGLPYVNYKIEGFEKDSINNYYNTFEIDELSPLTEYETQVSFSLKNNLNNNMSLTVGAVDFEVEQIYEDDKYVSNISFEDTNDFSEFNISNENKYYQTNLKIITDELGRARFVIGLKMSDDAKIDFNIGQVEIEINEIINGGKTIDDKFTTEQEDY